MDVLHQNTDRTGGLATDAAHQQSGVRAVHGWPLSLQSGTDGRAYLMVGPAEFAAVHGAGRVGDRSGRRVGGDRGRRVLSVVSEMESGSRARLRRADGEWWKPSLFIGPNDQASAQGDLWRYLRVLRGAWSRAARRAHHSAVSRRGGCVAQPDARLSALQLHQGPKDGRGVRLSSVCRVGC